MALGRKKEGGGQIEIPMSSMIDVVFLLLIYFIVTYQQEIPEAHLAVNLPGKSEVDTPPKEPPQLLELEVRPREYTLQGKTLSIGTLTDALTGIAENDPDVTVLVKVSMQAKTKNLVKLLDVCRGVGLQNLNVLTMQ